MSKSETLKPQYIPGTAPWWAEQRRMGRSSPGRAERLAEQADLRARGLCLECAFTPAIPESGELHLCRIHWALEGAAEQEARCYTEERRQKR